MVYQARFLQARVIPNLDEFHLNPISSKISGFQLARFVISDNFLLSYYLFCMY